MRFFFFFDANSDLKMKDMLLVEKYHAYNKLLQRMSENKCHGCIKLMEHIALIKEQKQHKEEVKALKYQMSDEALQQMPEFQGRVSLAFLLLFLRAAITVWRYRQFGQRFVLLVAEPEWIDLCHKFFTVTSLYNKWMLECFVEL